MSDNDGAAQQPQEARTDELVRRLRAHIRDNGFMPGEKVSSERALAERYGISRAQLRRALAVLESQREIVRRIGRGGGIVVADGKLERNLNTAESLPEIARRQGWMLTSKPLTSALIAADQSDVRLLRLGDGRHTVLSMTRLRLLDGEPLSVEENHLPAQLFPGFAQLDLTRPFYALFAEHYGLRVHAVDETLECVTAGARESKLLNVTPGTCLLKIHRLAYAPDGTPLERASDIYRADRVRVTMHHSGYLRLSATKTAPDPDAFPPAVPLSPPISRT
ncbi:GntR family transcriptional regulator [Bifidobacterium gallicum]|uniref:GntR family transcriptional regulator n=1 Tax=Bifidobacterium gallicum DSM 20093 = LMG 11596 TaxID=561180 RepID=D1NV72_9BIFI|nr:GntR family transcriptional regulator [Bifidobacterium gallicum]EFA22723.1 UbiC transcription regulator-associated domain protein [Bifidobacterium gallicum DSM 20093 = LMG 11596]KFI59672.1 GntR family transcriptional regulator [Bifidobacterium gallicum DSM 20093 = LMG 11596]